MPNTYSVDEAENFVYVRVIGVVAEVELRRHAADFLADRRIGPGFRELFDASTGIAGDVSKEVVDAILGLEQQYHEYVNGSRTALVMRGTFALRLANEYETEALGTVRVFDNLESAEEWLGYHGVLISRSDGKRGRSVGYRTDRRLRTGQLDQHAPANDGGNTMKITSRSLRHNEGIPATNAMGAPGPSGPVPGPNKSPQLAWSEFPANTKSFAVVCVDVDVPSRPDDVNKPDRTVPYDLPRVDFYHWLLVDIPPGITELAEGQDSDGVVPKGKKPGKVAYGVRGINDYTSWFGGDPQMGGEYGGYDGPWPPFNDERVHHYHFTVYALDVASLGLPDKFRGPDAIKAMEGHVLDRATLIGTYALYLQARE